MLYATDTSTTIKRTLTAEGRATALRLCPWGNGVRGFTGAGLHGERDEGIGLYMLGAGYRGVYAIVETVYRAGQLEPVWAGWDQCVYVL